MLQSIAATMVWSGILWYGLLYYGMVWYDMIYDMIWYCTCEEIINEANTLIEVEV